MNKKERIDYYREQVTAAKRAGQPVFDLQERLREMYKAPKSKKTPRINTV